MKPHFMNGYGVGASFGYGPPGSNTQTSGLSHQINSIYERLEGWGRLVLSNESLSKAISQMPDTGGKIILTEGDYLIRSQIRIKKPISFVSLAPNRTTITRKVAATDAMFWADSPGIRFDGITFNDEGQAGSCLRVTGDNCVISNCVFNSFKYAVYSDTDDDSLHSSWSSLINNRFVGPGVATASRGSDGNFIYEPPVNLVRGNQWVIHGNHFGEWGANSAVSDETNVILCGETFTFSVITSNVAPTQQIKYKADAVSGTSAQANIAVVVTY